MNNQLTDFEKVVLHTIKTNNSESYRNMCARIFIKTPRQLTQNEFTLLRVSLEKLMSFGIVERVSDPSNVYYYLTERGMKLKAS